MVAHGSLFACLSSRLQSHQQSTSMTDEKNRLLFSFGRGMFVHMCPVPDLNAFYVFPYIRRSISNQAVVYTFIPLLFSYVPHKTLASGPPGSPECTPSP